MSATPPLPKHLVIYDKPDPQRWEHIVTGNEYEIIGETFIEATGKEGFLYRRTDKDHPAVITRDKEIFYERFIKGKTKLDSYPVVESMDLLGNSIKVNQHTGHVTVKHSSGVTISIDPHGYISVSPKGRLGGEGQ